jgi:hypothetical protein
LAFYFNAEATSIGICLLPPLMGTARTDICSDEQ